MNILTDGNSDLNFNFKFLDGNFGLPWDQVAARQGIVKNKEFLGTDEEGFDVYRYVVAFDAPMTFVANNRYWLEVETDGIAWEVSSATSLNAPIAFSNDTTGGMWTFDAVEVVFAMVCDEFLNVSDLSASDFSYFPNPAKDVVNFQSKKDVKSVEAFNLAGQKVLSNSKLNNSQVNIHSLTPGTYVFKVTLEGGQIETFKIIKK